MKVPKRLAIFGFNLCASTFIGFCVYGLLVYEGDGSRHFSTMFWSLCALGIIGCIVGICYFGNQWDLRNIEKAREGRQAAATNPKQRK